VPQTTRSMNPFSDYVLRTQEPPPGRRLESSCRRKTAIPQFNSTSPLSRNSRDKIPVEIAVSPVLSSPTRNFRLQLMTSEQSTHSTLLNSLNRLISVNGLVFTDFQWGTFHLDEKSPSRQLDVKHGCCGSTCSFEMCENVHKWCSDWFDSCYYAISPERNPQGPEEGTRKASRGGSWRHHIKVSRCSARSSIPPEFQYADYAFRVVCSGAP
jgi:hypothetical protein